MPAGVDRTFERVYPFEGPDFPGRHRASANAVRAVASGDEIASDLLAFPGLDVAQKRSLPIRAVDRNVSGFIDDRRAGALTRIPQVLGQFGLAIDHDLLAAGQSEKVYAMAPAVEGEIETLVRQAFTAHALAQADLGEKIDGALFQHAGPDPRFDIGPAMAFEHQRFDAGAIEQMGEQQARRTRPDDGDLSAIPGHVS